MKIEIEKIDVIMTVLLIAFSAYVGFMIYGNYKTEQVQYKIHSYVRDKSMEGNFILGNGIINNKQVFVVYIENEIGALELKQFDARKTQVFPIIKEEETPYVVYDDYYYRNKSPDNIKLYVPENSIHQNMNGNLTSSEVGQ